MNADYRSPKFYWVAGTLLLVGTVIGTTFLLNNSGAQGVAPTSAGTTPAKHLGFCLGFVDVEHGITNPYPTQHGEVVAIRAEGFHAKKGDWLLKIDDRFQKLRLAEAQAALEEAEKAPDIYKLMVKEQEQVVQAAEKRKKAANFRINAAEREAKANEAYKQYQDKLEAARADAEQIDCEIAAARIKESQIQLGLAQLQFKIKQARAVVDQAQLAVDSCQLLTVKDGTLLRSFVHVGETLGANPKTPALQFAPDGRKIVRAEILQEWASRFKEGQTVEIEDDTYNGPKWSGKILSISKWYSHKRSIIFEPFTLNDVRSLECIIEINDPQDALCIGQRVRVGALQTQ